MDRGSWWVTVLEVAESDTTEQLSARTHAHTHTCTHTNIYFSLYIVLIQVKQHSAKMTLAIKSLQSAGRGGQTANSMQCNQC